MSDTLVFFTNAGFSVSSIFVCVCVLLSYFLKKRGKLEEKSILFILDLCSIILMSIMEIVYVLYYTRVGPDGQYAIALYHLYTIAILIVTTFSWSFVISYRLSIREDKSNNTTKKIVYYTIVAIVQIILGILIFVMPVKIFPEYGIYTFKSLAITITVAYTLVSTTLFTFLLFFKNKDITKQDIYPTVVSYVVVILLLVYRLATGIDINVETFQLTIFTLGIFFTIENQDFKLIEVAKQKQEAAQKATSSQKEFLANVSHQIRSPMNTVLGLTQLVLQEDNLKTDSARQDIQTIHDTATALTTMVNNIMDFSDVVSGKDDIETNEYDMQTLVIKLDNDIIEKISEDSIGFDFNISNNVPDKLYGDSNKISKILYNILNIMTSNPKAGKISLYVDAAKKTDSAVEVEFTVKSTGVTINQESFNTSSGDLMELSEEEINEKSLGLIIAKSLAERLNGKLELLSEMGKGTTCTLVLLQSTDASEIKKTEVSEEKEEKKEEPNADDIFEQSVKEQFAARDIKKEVEEEKISEEALVEEKKEEPKEEVKEEPKEEEKTSEEAPVEEEKDESKEKVKEESEEEKISEETPVEEKKEEPKEEVKEEPKEEEKSSEEAPAEEKKEEPKEEVKEEPKEEEKSSEETPAEEKKEEPKEEVKEEPKEEEKPSEETPAEEKKEEPKEEVKEEPKEEEKTSEEAPAEEKKEEVKEEPKEEEKPSEETPAEEKKEEPKEEVKEEPKEEEKTSEEAPAEEKKEEIKEEVEAEKETTEDKSSEEEKKELETSAEEGGVSND